MTNSISKVVISLSIIMFSLIVSCSNSSNESIDLVSELRIIGKELNSYDSKRILKVCTKNGFDSLLDWSDSLRDEKFIINLSENLVNDRITFVPLKDSVYQITIYNLIEDQTTTGGCDIKFINGVAKIDKFQGSTSIN